MSRMQQLRLAVLCSLLTCAIFAVGEDNQGQKFDRQFQSAVVEYNTGRFGAAAAQLEALLPHFSQNFQVEELLGMTYSSLSQDKKAIDHLKAAVRLNPDSAAARTNLAASLSHAGSHELAGEQFREALKLEPRDYTANHNLGEFYIQTGKIADALPFLKRAQQINPSAYDNGYDLAMANLVTGQLDSARQLVQRMLQEKNTGELHNLLAQIDEKDGKFVTAANEFETAARMEPNEENLFDWGSELLLHRTYDPAIIIFRQAALRYPDSARLEIGLGIALYSKGLYEEAVTTLLKAADMNPSDSRCYLFLFKAYESSPKQGEEVIERFRRYSELEPNNARAQFYYAMSLWKGTQSEGSAVNLQAVESLLNKSIKLDGTIPDVHVQLGNLYAGQHQYEKSIAEYLCALNLNPNLSDAHYRLATDYVHVGQKDRAQSEFQIYQKLRTQHMAEIDKEKAEVQQFVYSAQAAPSTKP